MAFFLNRNRMLIESHFKPAWWLNNAHLQTLWPALLRRVDSPPRRRERLETDDQDFIDLDWCGEDSGPIVILLHGLTGSSQSNYIKGMQHALLKLGLRSVAMNFRGCGGQSNLSARCYHSGDTADVDYLYRRLKQREPATSIAAIGYSLGGNVLLKWLGEQGSRIALFAAAAVSVPFVLNLCADRMDLGFSQIYRNQLLRELKYYLRRKQRYLLQIGQMAEAEKIKQLGDLSRVRSFWEYDDRVVAPLYSFQNAHDYYQQSSSRQYLHKITVPTLMIQSIDDPFMSCEVIPHESELSASTQLEVTPGGGHVGFVAGKAPAKPVYWLEQRIPAFLQARLNAQSC